MKFGGNIKIHGFFCKKSMKALQNDSGAGIQHRCGNMGYSDQKERTDSETFLPAK